MRKSRIGALFNMRAGKLRGTSSTLKESLSVLDEFEAFCVVSSGQDSFAESMARLPLAELEILVVFGGDGTLNKVLPYVAQKNISLALMPAGTANDLAAQYGLKRDLQSLKNILSEPKPEKMDLVSVNGQLYATVGGIGIGSHISEKINQLRDSSRTAAQASKFLGAHIYPMMALKTIVMGESLPRKILVRSDEHEQVVQTAAIFVSNQALVGSKISVAPQARNNDGMIDVLVIQAESKAGLLHSLLAMRSGQEPEPCLRFSGKKIVLKSLDGQAIPVFGDGEPLVKSDALTFEVLNGALQILRPR